MRCVQSVPIRQFLLTNLVRPPGEGFLTFRIPLGILGRSLESMGSFPYQASKARQFQGPTLFVRGTRSAYIPKDRNVLSQFFPHFELVELDSGHWVISEQPGHFKRGKVSGLLGRP